MVLIPLKARAGIAALTRAAVVASFVSPTHAATITLDPPSGVLDFPDTLVSTISGPKFVTASVMLTGNEAGVHDWVLPPSSSPFFHGLGIGCTPFSFVCNFGVGFTPPAAGTFIVHTAITAVLDTFGGPLTGAVTGLTCPSRLPPLKSSNLGEILFSPPA
jgi:hypothetical protein